jgi:hypothetical protein
VGLVLGAPYPLGIFTIRDRNPFVNTLFHFFLFAPERRRKPHIKARKKGFIGGKPTYEGRINRFIGGLLCSGKRRGTDQQVLC